MVSFNDSIKWSMLPNPHLKLVASMGFLPCSPGVLPGRSMTFLTARNKLASGCAK
jgi:hypothetical protein